MKAGSNMWAVVPVKEISWAKQRLSTGVPSHLRQGLVLAMLEDVLSAVSLADGLEGIIIVTLDARVSSLAKNYGARILTAGARDGHTTAVAAAVGVLAGEGVKGIMQLPGDIPLVTPDEISSVLSMHRPAPSFTIVPSHDDFGSNAVVVSPPDAVPLTFGEDSYFPHLRTAQRHGIEPSIIRLPGIGRDIDTFEDLAAFARMNSSTRAQVFLDRNGFADWNHFSTAGSQVKDSKW